MSWWGQRLSDAVEELIDPGRLQRGRTLARTGSVLSMTVEPGRVSGQVQGSEARPYTASFLLAPLLDADAEAVLGLLEGQPDLVAAMVAGELPPVLGEPVHGLFPRYSDELDFECTCPDWGWPCKHAAALDDLDAELLRALLRSAGGGAEGAEDAVAWLRDAYGRLR